jgi:ribosomal protein S18 acetylase RimI-like enzyme
MAMLTDRGPLEVERVLAFLREVDAGASTRTVALPFGIAYFHDELPHVWDRNFVLVERDREDVDAASVAAAVETLQAAAGLAHRKLVFEDESVAAALAPALVGSGWERRPLSLMLHDGNLAHNLARAAVEAAEVDRLALEPAMERLMRTELQRGDAEAARELLRADVPIAGFLRQRCFARLVAGDVTSYCRLFARDGLAQIEDVATLPHWRGRGYARAVVSKALVEARDAELVFLTAVSGRWVERWYERLGFRRIGLRYEFTKQL